MTYIALLMVGFGLFAGILMYYVFKQKKPYKFQLIVYLAIVILALLVNFTSFFAFGEMIKPLIPHDKYDGDYGWFVGLQAGGAMLSVFAIGMIIGSAIGLSKSKNFRQLVETAPVPKTALTSEEGKNAILKCPKCGTHLPMKWLMFSSQRTKYVCRQCGELLVWTRRRMVVACLVGVCGVPLVMGSKYALDSYWPGVVVAIVVLILASTLIPGQYRVEE